MMDGASLAEFGTRTQWRLLLLVVVVVFGAHTAALFVVGTQISAVKSLGAAETQMCYVGELKLETLAAFQACVRGQPWLVSKHHTRTAHDYSASLAGHFAIIPFTNPLLSFRV